MNSKKLVAAFVAVTALAAPATAAAHKHPSVASVNSHAAAATAALDRVEQLVAAHDQAAATVAYAKSRVQTKAAAADARSLTRKRGRAAAVRAAQANTVLASLNDANAASFADLIAQVDALQLDFAKALAASVKGRDAAFAALSDLLTRLPADIQAGIASAIAALTADGQIEVADLVNLVGSGDILAVAKPWLDLALDSATAGINHALEHLNEVLDLVPAVARPAVEMALGLVTSTLEMVRGILDGIFSGGTPGAGGATGGGLLPDLSGLLGSLPIPDFVLSWLRPVLG